MSTAYNDGLRNGRLDAQCGVKSDYAWNFCGEASDYAREYSQGYRDGWNKVSRVA